MAESPTPSLTRLLGGRLRAAEDVRVITDQIYVGWLPQVITLPAVTMVEEAMDQPHAMGRDTNVRIATWDFHCWASGVNRVADAVCLADAVEGALGRWRSPGPPRIQDIWLENRVHLPESDEEVDRVRLTFSIAFERADNDQRFGGV